MYLITSFVVICCLCDMTVFSIGISCRNEKNGAVDWFINYKLPKLEDRDKNSLLGQGLAYAYLLLNGKKWTISENAIISSNSMMGNTLADFYNDKKELTYLIYNDNSPDEESGSSVGHTKGVIVFDEDTGFWLIHSIPKFPSVNEYTYPSNGLENGQSILCLTFNIHSLNEIGKQLLYNSPNIYAKHLNADITDQLEEDVLSLFTDKPNFIRKAPFSRITSIKTRGGRKITSFAKDNQFDKDLYSALIAPELKTSLNVETWRRGSGTKMNPECRLKYQVVDVQAINMTAIEKRKTVNVGFLSTEDHSKWAIAESSTSKWVCVGDINRMESQKKRGGGAACFSAAGTWYAFNSVIKAVESCSN